MAATKSRAAPRKGARPAGEANPGTDTTAAETAAADLERIDEAVTPPGSSLDEVRGDVLDAITGLDQASARTIPAMLAERPDDAEPGEAIGGFLGDGVAEGAAALMMPTDPAVLEEHAQWSRAAMFADAVPRLRVRAIDPRGFRRAGCFWPHAGVEISADALSVEQLHALIDEPELVVTQLAEPADE